MGPTHIAVRSFLKDLREFHGLTLKPAVASSKNVVRLAIAEGTVKTAGTGDVTSQGYLLKIAPGLIETPMLASMNDAARNLLINKVPMMHTGDPSDIAEAAAFLGSEGAAFITGVVLDVDGGISIGSSIR